MRLHGCPLAQQPERIAKALPANSRLSVAPSASTIASALEAVRISGITGVFPEVEPDSISMGVFGKVIKDPGSHTLQEGDRVELYRPLKIDPKQARLNRARKKDKDQ